MDSSELTKWFAWMDAKRFRDEHAHAQAEKDQALDNWVNEG
jgi:hypothetical protein